jgi:HNH endonuclease
MSKNLIRQLITLYENGELLDAISVSASYNDLLPYLGFSKNTSKYVSIIRYFCIDKNIPAEDFFEENIKSLHPKELKTCPVCGKRWEIPSNNKRKKEQTTCSIGCSNTYFRSGENANNFSDLETNLKSTYRKRALKEYGAKCADCGLENIKVLEVHHIDENRDNNHINNLVVLCRNCHQLRHT